MNESRSDPEMHTASTTPIHFSGVVQFWIFLGLTDKGPKGGSGAMNN